MGAGSTYAHFRLASPQVEEEEEEDWLLRIARSPSPTGSRDASWTEPLPVTYSVGLLQLHGPTAEINSEYLTAHPPA